MSGELDLFGETIAEEKKKPAKKAPAPVIVHAASRVDVPVYRECIVIKTGRHSTLLINADCAHLFR